MIHLDTGFLILALIPGSKQDRQLRTWVKGNESLSISSIAWAEFLCGPLKEEDAMLAAAIIGEAIPFTADDSRHAATVFNESGRRRGTFPDCMIAAVAINHDAALATSNPRDFRTIPDLALID